MSPGAIRLVAIALAMAQLLLGCVGDGRPVGQHVPLLTGVDSCYAGGESGKAAVLLVDHDYGTSFDGQPVMWPIGFTAIRDGATVVIIDDKGRVLAQTGRRYFMSFGPVAPGTQRLVDRIHAYPAAANCPYPHDFVDCGAVAPDTPRDAAEACRG